MICRIRYLFAETANLCPSVLQNSDAKVWGWEDSPGKEGLIVPAHKHKGKKFGATSSEQPSSGDALLAFYNSLSPYSLVDARYIIKNDSLIKYNFKMLRSR